MKRRNILKQRLLAIVLAVCCLRLAGCVAPDFSTTVRSPDVRGRVVDTETGEAVQNARIYWTLYTNEVTTTDGSGNFHLPGASNHHYLKTRLYAGIYGIAEDTYPQDARPCNAIVITHPGYDPYDSEASFQVRDDRYLKPGSDKTSSQLVLRDIRLRSLHHPFSRQLADAADQGDMAAVNLLIAEHPGLVNATEGNPMDSTPLHFAAHNGHTDVIRVLLAHGANINARGFHGVTPLMDAAAIGQTEAVTLLLANHADPSLKDYSGKTALDFAHEGQWTKIEAMLKEDKSVK